MNQLRKIRVRVNKKVLKQREEKIEPGIRK